MRPPPLIADAARGWHLGLLLVSRIEHNERRWQLRLRAVEVERRPPRDQVWTAQIALVHLDSGDGGKELIGQLGGHLLHLLEEHVEGLRAKGVADADGDDQLHELVECDEEPVDSLVSSGEGDVDGRLEKDEERGEGCEVEEHAVLAVDGRRARVDTKGPQREELRLEDPQVGEDREGDVCEHRHVHDDHRHQGDDRLHRQLDRDRRVE
mmetsp:Transcript_32225/g.69275  ORF Transcript_32225/g.69275 Transcript_32225/m.69275 type:complete len:209 (-) Transcript_32225:1120-1746(-)